MCRQMLARGFTSVRDCGGATLALKQAIADDLVEGPRLFIAGKALSQTGGHGDTRGSYSNSSYGYVSIPFHFSLPSLFVGL